MTEEIDSKQAIILYAQHIEGKHSAQIYDYESARQSLGKKLAYALRDFDGNGLVKKSKSLEDFELIGCIDSIIRKEDSSHKGALQGMIAVGTTFVIGVAGTLTGGWVAGSVMAGSVFWQAQQKLLLNLHRNIEAKKIAAVISSTAEERIHTSSEVYAKHEPAGPR